MFTGRTTAGRKAELMIIKYTAEELQHIEDLKQHYRELLLQATDHKEKGRLSLQLSEELTEYTDSCQRERFKDLEGKPEEILANAQEQIALLIEAVYKGLTTYSTPEDLKKLGISTTTNGKAYINANFMGDLIRNELRLHIEALRDDKERLQQLFTSIVDAIESSDYTDNAEIRIDPADKAPVNVMRFRRSPIADISTYGLMNDKANAQLIQDGGIFQTTPDGQMQLLWNVNQAPQGREEVPVYIALTYDGIEKGLSKPLSAYEIAVYNAVSNLFYYWKRENPQKPLYVTPQEIWRRMNGKQNKDGSAKPSAAQVKKICRSMDKMRHIDLYMDISEELKANYVTLDDERLVGGYIKDYLINCSEAGFYTEQGRKVRGYRINYEPVLYTYNAAKDHVLFLPFDLLDTSSALSDSENVTEFKHYLLQQILLMKNGVRNNRNILLNTIYTSTGIQPPEERVEGKEYKTEANRQKEIRRFRLTDRQKIEKLLDAWKEKGWIKNYTVLNQKNEPIRERQQAKGYHIDI